MQRPSWAFGLWDLDFWVTVSVVAYSRAEHAATATKNNKQQKGAFLVGTDATY